MPVEIWTVIAPVAAILAGILGVMLPVTLTQGKNLRREIDGKGEASKDRDESLREAINNLREDMRPNRQK